MCLLFSKVDYINNILLQDFHCFKTSKSVCVNLLRKTKNIFSKNLALKGSKTLLRCCLPKHHWHQRCCSMRICLQEAPVARNLLCKLPWRWLCRSSCAEWQPLRAELRLEKRTDKDHEKGLIFCNIQQGWLSSPGKHSQTSASVTHVFTSVCIF